MDPSVVRVCIERVPRLVVDYTIYRYCGQVRRLEDVGRHCSVDKSCGAAWTIL